MIKQSITELFDNFESNKIIDVPRCEFKPTRNPLQYLVPERINYRDFRQFLKPNPTSVDLTKQTITDKLKRYADEFSFRRSAYVRALTHTLQYTTIYGLIVFGFYSRQFSGLKRTQYVLKEILKTSFYSGSIFGLNEVLYPFCYKYAKEINQKPMFTPGNLMSTVFVWPFILLIQRKLLVSIRKTLFICAWGMFRDLQSQNQRFYKLFPNHLSSRFKVQMERLKHPCEDPFKRIITKHSRALQERKREEQEDLKRQVLAMNNGEKIPSSHMYLIMPDVYRLPTVEEKLEHERKAAIKTQKMLDQKGIKWISMDIPEEKSPEQMKRIRQSKRSWWPW